MEPLSPGILVPMNITGLLGIKSFLKQMKHVHFSHTITVQTQKAKNFTVYPAFCLYVANAIQLNHQVPYYYIILPLLEANS